jgi:hypothetical protein
LSVHALRIETIRAPLKTKRAGIACWIYRWKLTASRIHVSPQQNYARPKKSASGEMKIIFPGTRAVTRSYSLTPGFSRVIDGPRVRETVSTVLSCGTNRWNGSSVF